MHTFYTLSYLSKKIICKFYLPCAMLVLYDFKRTGVYMMKTKKTIFSYKLTCSLLAFFLFFCSFSFVGCGRSKEPVSKSDFYFNTVITITLYGEENASYIDDCFKLASHYENLFSNTIADSDISKINNAGGTPVTVDDDTIELLQKGIYYGDLSLVRFHLNLILKPHFPPSTIMRLLLMETKLVFPIRMP